MTIWPATVQDGVVRFRVALPLARSSMKRDGITGGAVPKTLSCGVITRTSTSEVTSPNAAASFNVRYFDRLPDNSRTAAM